LLKSLQEAEIGLQYIKEKTNFWDKYRDKELNSRQIKVLNKILDIGSKNFEGGLTKRKYVAIAKTSTSTATNDLKQLVDLGCIKQTPGTVGKSTSYFINILF
jgi:Fic family protein